MGSLCWWYDRETFLPPAKTVTHQRNNLLSDIIASKTDNNFKRISNDIAGFGLLGNFEGVNQLQDNLFIREIVTGRIIQRIAEPNTSTSPLRCFPALRKCSASPLSCKASKLYVCCIIALLMVVTVSVKISVSCLGSKACCE